LSEDLGSEVDTLREKLLELKAKYKAVKTEKEEIQQVSLRSFKEQIVAFSSSDSP
jgi:hypothetical protein